MGSGSKASFTPFVDPRVYQTSPTEDDEDASGKTAYIALTSEKSSDCWIRQNQTLVVTVIQQ